MRGGFAQAQAGNHFEERIATIQLIIVDRQPAKTKHHRVVQLND
ncbi:hypothetical protein [Pseudomonas sp. On1]|nr:hypothetical protein [Pseudomonas sp. On1]MDX2310567.1 hypothetical protein [Pseudomonas sp. On1]